MNSKIFATENNHNIIEVRHFLKSHKTLFFIRSIEDINEIFTLMNNMIEYLKQEDIKWVIAKLPSFQREKIDIPINTVYFNNKTTGDLNIHIEDFLMFFKKNFIYFIHEKNLFIPPRIDNEGWIHHVDVKKEYDIRFHRLETEFNEISSS